MDVRALMFWIYPQLTYNGNKAFFGSQFYEMFTRQNQLIMSLQGVYNSSSTKSSRLPGDIYSALNIYSAYSR